MLHETERIYSTDRYIITGGNPDGNGGGVIGTRNRLDDAIALHAAAIQTGYTNVRMMTWEELMKDKEAK